MPDSLWPSGSSVHGIFQQEYWSGLPFPFPSQGTFPTQGLNLHLLCLLLWQAGSLLAEPSGKLLNIHALPLFAALTEAFCLVLCLVSQSCMTLCDPMYAGSSVHGNSPGKNTGMGCHFLFQGIFPIQGSNWGLLYYVQIPYHLNYQGSHLPYQFPKFKSYLFFLLQLNSSLSPCLSKSLSFTPEIFIWAQSLFWKGRCI